MKGATLTLVWEHWLEINISMTMAEALAAFYVGDLTKDEIAPLVKTYAQVAQAQGGHHMVVREAVMQAANAAWETEQLGEHWTPEQREAVYRGMQEFMDR